MNIFARELAQLLAEHGKVLGSLFGLRAGDCELRPNKVTRLKRSLTEDIMATLNAEELELVANWLKWKQDGDEIRRLRAALVAESVRHLMGGRINQDQAQELGEITFQLLLGQEPEELLTLREELMDGIRGGIPLEEDERDFVRGFSSEQSAQSGSGNTRIEDALEPAINTYEQGALWLEIARTTNDQGTRLGYLAQARALLVRALNLAINPPTIAMGSATQQEWLTIIKGALTEATALG